MGEMKEIKRVAGFSSGDFPCIRCGKAVTLYFNGGELDSSECCGLTYKTEATDYHLSILEKVVLEGV